MLDHHFMYVSLNMCVLYLCRIILRGKISLQNNFKEYTYISRRNLRLASAFDKQQNKHKWRTLSFNNFHKRRAFFTWSRERKADVIFFQETNSPEGSEIQ